MTGNDNMKTTAFTQKHIALGAKMVPFAGYNMPVEYVGINEEHRTVRNGVGVFDVSHMGEFWVKGPNALAFVQYVSSNDASVLYPGKIQYDCFPNGKGGIVDDFLAYCIDGQTYLLVVNAANIEKDWNHLCAIAPKFGLTPGKELYNASDEILPAGSSGTQGRSGHAETLRSGPDGYGILHLQEGNARRCECNILHYRLYGCRRM